MITCRILTRCAGVFHVSFRKAEARMREEGASEEFFRHAKHWAIKVDGVPPVGTVMKVTPARQTWRTGTG